MIISDIQPQKKRKNRFSIYIDGKYAFSLDFNTLKKNILHVGDEITLKEIDLLKKKDEFWRARDYALSLISYRMRSERELKQRLRHKGYAFSTVGEVIVFLKRIGIVDDRKFAEDWVNSTLEHRPMGRFRVRFELRKRGVNDNIIDELCDKVFTEGKEEELILKASEKKLKSLRDYPPELRVKRLISFLKGRGFEYESIHRVTKEIFSEDSI